MFRIASLLRSCLDSMNAARLAARAGLLAAITMGLAAGLAPHRAEAGHKWIGPAIAGAVIGGAIVHSLHRHHYRHAHKPYRHAHKPWRQYQARHHQPKVKAWRHHRPVVIVPAPVVVYRHAPRYHYVQPHHHRAPGVSIGLHFGW